MFADRMNRLGTETAFEVLARAKALERQGRDIIHLEIGEPDFNTPQNIIDAAKEALDQGFTHYGPAAGQPDVREAFAKHIAEDRGLAVDAENIVITPGAKPIIFFSLFACVNKGEEVIYPNPGFPIYESVINFIGAKAVPIQLKEERDFRLDPAELVALITDKTKMILLNSPQNPTGGVLSSEDMGLIAKAIGDRDIWVLSDEVYSKILYEGRHVSIAQMPGMLKRTILLEGHSKTYAMTGWRLGYGVMNKELAAHITRLMTNCNSCTNVFVQRAGMKAVTDPQDKPKEMVKEFKKRRDVIVDGLNKIPGITCLKPRGAFYVFPNITGTGIKSQALESALLEKAGVAALSGTSFGKFGE
ncbi:MAG: pyridoxal phosphate-dependent aminotransferase, partial [Candidatus Eisenbacteria bacterium]|nr:pyridoxal phosphate-dependent aminotransferase [Candidatus Eisenbacteria bacterium]